MKTKTHKIAIIQLMRLVSQILFFIFLPALYISTFNGIKQIYLAVLHHSFSFTALLPQIVEAIAIIPATIVLGRFFCGWMCAFGSMGDWIYKLSAKVFRKKFKVSEKADRLLKWTKYALLVFLIGIVWTYGLSIFRSSDPWDAFGMLLTVGEMPDFSYVAANLTLALVILVLIIIGSFFVERFFCRYLCPLGAVFAITSKLRFATIRKPSAKCGNCRICTRNCPMGIALYKENTVKSGECISCFACVSSCPRKNVSIAVAEKDVRPALAGTMAVMTMTGLYYAGSAAANGDSGQVTAMASISANASTSDAVQKSSEVSSKYKDGTYTGSGIGFKGRTTTVSVTVKSGKISDVAIVSTGDDRPYVNRAFPTVKESIIDSQSTDVSAVSGATYTSRGIMDAVSNALSKAK